MQTFRFYMLTCALAMLNPLAYAGPADRFADVEISAQHVAGSIHMLVGAGGNIAATVGPDGTLIVDDQFPELGGRIQDALVKLGGDKPKLILNTHWHGDHTGSNPLMGETGTIISHHNVRVRLLGLEDYPRSGLPLVTYSDRLQLHFNDEEIEVIHLPTGHTDGDSVVWFKTANVIHMGDHFFNQRFPFVDVASGGSVDGFIANVRQVLAMIPEDISIIPGHGPLANKDDLTFTIDTVAKTAEEIRKRLQAGDSDDDIVAWLDKNYQTWGSGFINAARWVLIIKGDANR